MLQTTVQQHYSAQQALLARVSRVAPKTPLSASIMAVMQATVTLICDIV